MPRVLIIGCPGSGKSTLAKTLANRTGLPLVHLDRIYWRPGWIEPDKDEWRTQVEQELSKPSWIMDGNYGGTLQHRLQFADEVILLDLPRSLCLLRVMKRIIINRGKTRPDMGPGCPERFDLPFLHYIWSFRRQKMPETMQLLQSFTGRVTILRTVREIDSFGSSWLPRQQVEGVKYAP